ncbi:MAG: hypothetical protein F6K31_02550 [Symploca sp. SIO2G7]|nr:hypothetical protein [Symploca sp. SIO2G7]
MARDQLSATSTIQQPKSETMIQQILNKLGFPGKKQAKLLEQQWFSQNNLPEHLYWDSKWTELTSPINRLAHLKTAIAMTGIDRQIAVNLAEGILTLFPHFNINDPALSGFKKLLEQRMETYVYSLITQ